MNIILDAPLPTALIAKQEYDNKILYVFLIFMVVLGLLGLLFVDLTKGPSALDQKPSIDKDLSLPTQTEYAKTQVLQSSNKSSNLFSHKI